MAVLPAPSAILQRLYAAPDPASCHAAGAELADFVQETGLHSLADHDILNELLRASKSKSGFERESAMVGFEEIFRRTQPGAEAYYLPLLPEILAMYAETGKGEVVKDAAERAAKAFVALPPPEQCIKVIDTLFNIVDSNGKWRVKAGALDVLALVVERCKDQVSERLGTIIPRLTHHLQDTKPEVAQAATRATEKVCSVLSNPDVIPFIPILVSCMARPDTVPEGINKLSANVWVRDVDAPTLAILVPLLIRALNDRSATVQRQTVILIGNLFKLVRSFELAAHHVPHLLPGVSKIAETAAFPEVRAFGRDAKQSMLAASAGVETEAAEEALDPSPDDEKTSVSLLVELFTKQTGAAPDAFVQTTLSYVSHAVSVLVKKRDFDDKQWQDVYVAPYLARFMSSTQAQSVCKEANRQWVEIDLKRNASDLEDDDGADGELLTNIQFSLAYGGLLLLNHTVLKLRRGHRYGVCGTNGCGKSTLLKAINRHQVENWPESLSTFYVEHDIDGEESEANLFEFLCNDRFVKATGASPDKVKKFMFETGFDENRQAQTVQALSGGWKMRLALARAMICEADVLLLDEPTNHLDRASIEWLQGYLNALTHVTVLVVSHDSGFLDAICTDIIHYEKKRLVYYKGNLAKFVDQHPAAKSYYTLSASLIKFSFPPPGGLMGVRSKTRAIVKMTDVTFTYPGAPKPSLYNASCAVTLSSRVGVVGPNGAGKSTLIKVLTGETIPDSGRVEKHPNLRIAMVAQHAFAHIEQHLTRTAVDYIRWRYQDGHDRELAATASRKLSAEEKKILETPIKASTGEERRVEMIIGRQKLKKSFTYELKWKGLDHRFNNWIPRERLFELGFSKIVQQFDDFEASREGSGSRELTGPAIRKHLEDIGLDGDIAQYNELKGLSGGQKVKVVIAAALWAKPQLLILDEPTNFLDRDALGGLAVAIREWDGAFVCISHNTEFVGALCPEIWNVEGGKLIHKGKAAIVDDAFDDSKENTPRSSRFSSRVTSRVASATNSASNSATPSRANSGDEAAPNGADASIPMPVVKKKKLTRKQQKEREERRRLRTVAWLSNSREGATREPDTDSD
ncbi:hypothetical protein E5Q_06457 [Mixia osmundae IAM 14324]|uniref:Chromo domain-containing protein n=1 Tax=Mixia osmundae (strain CBS 9802 / IAM 14324 / JCM 22182 / KY 12970) TaxID=764103 RepID=G7EA94_MIXOS|nr:hypothetical protein E5Q_06457 [Mixia osmundae IAM 14324]